MTCPAARKPGVDQVARGRLAVGAGDADHDEVVRGVAVHARTRPRRARARGSSTTSTGSPVAAARSAPAGSVRTATAPGAGRLRDELGAVGAEARAGRRTGRPASTARESWVTPVTRTVGRRRRGRATRRPPRRPRSSGRGGVRRTRSCGHGDDPIGRSPGDRDARRDGAGRRDPAVLEAERHDLLEHRAGEHAAEVAVARVLQEDRDDQRRGCRRARCR